MSKDDRSPGRIALAFDMRPPARSSEPRAVLSALAAVRSEQPACARRPNRLDARTMVPCRSNDSRVISFADALVVCWDVRRRFVSLREDGLLRTVVAVNGRQRWSTAQVRWTYSALSTDIGVTRTALSAGTNDPANVINNATPTAVANVAGSPGAMPKSSALMARAAR